MCLESRGASCHLGKEVISKKMGQGSNPETRASEEDALSTPQRPTWLNEFSKSLSFFRHKALVRKVLLKIVTFMYKR